MPRVCLRHAVPVAVLLAAGCGKGPVSAEQARRQAVVEAGTARLTGAELERLVSRSPAAPTAQHGEGLASAWIDWALVAQVLEDGLDLAAPALVSDALWADSLAGLLAVTRDVLAERRNPLPPAAADSIYAADEVRAMQHIMFRATPDEARARRAQLQARIDEAARRLRAGEPFATVAAAMSDDDSRAAGGILPARPRGVLPEPFDRIAWEMQPDEIRGPVQTAYGVHIVRRPPASEVVREVLQAAQALRHARADSAWADSLARAYAVTVEREAAARYRRLLAEPMAEAAAGGGGPFATWRGGALGAAAVRRWSAALSPEQRAELRYAADTRLETVLRELATNTVALEEAVRLGAVLTRTQWATRLKQYALALPEVLAVAERAPGPDAGARAVAILDSLAATQTPYRRLPAGLGLVLRDRYGARVDTAAVTVIARAVEATRDSLAREERRRRAAGDTAAGRS